MNPGKLSFGRPLLKERHRLLCTIEYPTVSRGKSMRALHSTSQPKGSHCLTHMSESEAGNKGCVEIDTVNRFRACTRYQVPGSTERDLYRYSTVQYIDNIQVGGCCVPVTCLERR